MRLTALCCMLCLTFVTMSCDQSSPVEPGDQANTRLSMFETGTITVFVHWDNEGLANKRVELLELGLVKTTNRDGIAVFRVRPGQYTVRVYEINRGGPPMHYIDTKVPVRAHERTQVDVVDCLPCV